VCQSHCGLAIYNKKSILTRQKKNYGNSNISPMQKNILIFLKNPLNKETKNPSR
jgi:hypothetical protein